MAILSNTPTLSYIYVREMVITYNDVPYNILNMYTSKSYIFWDASDPYRLIASNRMLEEKLGRYYICFNDKGNPTLVPQVDLEISFAESGNNGDLITEKILGFENTLEANEYRFTTIETSIDHLKTVVGGSGSDGNNYYEQFSKIEQEMDRIEAEVSRVEREYGNDEELRLLRENTNIAILELQSVLGAFLSDMQKFMEDNESTDEEEEQIAIYKNNMETERAKLNLQIDTVLARLEAQNEPENVARLTSQKEALNNSIDNLYNNIDIACTDGKFTNMEMATVISYFSTVGNKINETNSMINEFIFLESGGKLIEKLSKVEQTVNSWGVRIIENGKTLTELKLTDEEFEVSIGKKADATNIISMINASSEGIKIQGSKVNVVGFVTFSDLSSEGQTIINGSNITTGTINAKLANIVNINASNITTGTLSGDHIKGGTIVGSLFKTHARTEQGGVEILEDSLQIGYTTFHYADDRFKIEGEANMSMSSKEDIYIMAGINQNGTVSGTGEVYVYDTLRVSERLFVKGVEITGQSVAVFG